MHTLATFECSAGSTQDVLEASHTSMHFVHALSAPLHVEEEEEDGEEADRPYHDTRICTGSTNPLSLSLSVR